MTDRTTDHQIREFIERIDQLNRLHQKAVVILAAKSIRERQDERDALLVTATQPKLRARYWLGNLFKKLIHRLGIPCPRKRAEEKSVEINYSDTQRHIILDITPLPWPLDQSLLAEDDIEFLPRVTHSNDEKKGDQSHE